MTSLGYPGRSDVWLCGSCLRSGHGRRLEHSSCDHDPCTIFFPQGLVGAYMERGVE